MPSWRHRLFTRNEKHHDPTCSFPSNDAPRLGCLPDLAAAGCHVAATAIGCTLTVSAARQIGGRRSAANYLLLCSQWREHPRVDAEGDWQRLRPVADIGGPQGASEEFFCADRPGPSAGNRRAFRSGYLADWRESQTSTR